MTDSFRQALVPANIKKLSPYVAGKTIAEVRKAYHPKQISKLASNENRLGCSPKVPKAVKKALKEIQDYPDPSARKLKAALAERNGVSSNNITIACGSESIIANLCRTFFLQDETAITANATFVGFFVQAGIHNVDLEKVPITPDFRFDVDAIAKAITDQTKMIYIANPNNPTGTYINKQELERLMDVVPSNIIVVMDEAYFEYAEDIEDYPHALGYDYSNIISLRTFSKAYGLAGFRVGYAIGPEVMTKNMNKTKLAFEPTALGQAAALAALEDEGFLSKSKQVVENGKKELYTFFDERDISYVPSISNSVLMICSDEKTAKRFTQAMLEEGVILRRTNAFGLPYCIRITIGTEENMKHFKHSFDKLSNVLEI